MDKIDAQYLLKLAGDEKRLFVANVGCGPNSIESARFTNGLSVGFVGIDKRDYQGVLVGDMEALDHPDGFFDGSMCINALDHTKDAEKALKELIRVAKSWVYVNCNLVQKTTSGKGHYWDMLEDGTMTDGERSFNLKHYGFNIHLIQYGGERRYDQVIAWIEK